MMNSIRKIPFTLLNSHFSSISTRCCKRVSKDNVFKSARRFVSTYDGDGKTSASILNIEENLGLMIVSYSPHGFRLNNRLFVRGPMVIFPNTALSWQVSEVDDITLESLSLFPILEPRIDIVVIGLGDYDKMTRESRASIAKIMKNFKIPVEILPTDVACTTFNFLVAEDRFVGGALLPKMRGYDYDKDTLDRAVVQEDILHLKF